MRRFVTVLFVSLLAAQAQEGFWSLAQKGDRLEEQNKFQEAVAVYQEAAKRFPDRAPQVEGWLAYGYILTGEYAKTMEIWRKGHEQGFFYGIPPTRDPFKRLASVPGFDAVAKRDAELSQAAEAKNQMRYEMATPASYSANRKYPLFIVLHAGSDTIEHAKTYWTSPGLKQRYLVAYLQSYIPRSSWNYSWRGSDQKAREGVRKLYKEIVAKYPVDTTRVFIGGMSAGGMMSLDVVFQNLIPAAGFVTNCPVIPPDFAPGMAAQMRQRGVRGAIITGDKDFAYERQKQVVEAFTKAGLPHQFTVIPGMGHQIPPDFSSRLDAALAEIDKAR